jgi:hypothetical protein
MPTVMNNYVITPSGPFNSTGAVSLMYYGTNTLNAPVDIPYMNLPTAIT